jgi:5-methylcytosine-specific restriction endonuclease McrA
VSGALVLNASFEPLCIVSTRRALCLVLTEKADLLHRRDGVFHSEHLAFPEPSVVRLRTYVRVPFAARVSLNRRAVFARDGGRCQYCGAPAENIDHVIPRSKGGPHTWENVVAACRPCNAKKQDHHMGETTMVLRHHPAAPRARNWVLAAIGGARPEWEPYLGGATLSA